MNALDLFCGCGGASLGLKSAGYTVVGAVDNDPLACEIYSKNLGLEPICADLRTFSGQEILDHYDLKKGDIDLIVGCPPCQGFSSLRKTRHPDGVDPRKSLVNVFCKKIADVQPRAVIFENVRGITSKHGLQYYLKRFLTKLEKMGYSTNWKLINAADYGVAQFRKRVFALAVKGPDKPTFLDETHSNPNNQTTSDVWKTVRDMIENLPPLNPGEECDSVLNHRARAHSERVMKIIRHIPKDGGGRKSLPKNLWLECHKKLEENDAKGAESIYGRMTWDKPAPTITCRCTTPSSGRFLHPEQDRAITPREAARIQTFPDTFEFPHEFGASERLIGNAVPAKLLKVQLKNFEGLL